MKSYELGSPIRTNLEITEICSLSCKHCYTYWGYASTGYKIQSNTKRYSLEHFVYIVDRLSSLGVRMLTLTGGEPFVKKDLLFPLMSTAKDRKMNVFVNTSASLITQNDSNKMKKVLGKNIGIYPFELGVS